MNRCGRRWSFDRTETSASGSVTIETVLILPVFLILVSTILSVIFSAYTTLSDACDVLRDDWMVFSASGPGEIMRIIRIVMETGEKIANGMQ